MRIWAKVISDGKIKKQTVYEKAEPLTYSALFDYMTILFKTLQISVNSGGRVKTDCLTDFTDCGWVALLGNLLFYKT